MENRLLDMEPDPHVGGWYSADENVRLYHFTYDIATRRALIAPEFYQDCDQTANPSAFKDPTVHLHPEDMRKITRIRDQMDMKITRRFCCKLRLRALQDYQTYPFAGTFQTDGSGALGRVTGYVIGISRGWHFENLAMQLERAVNLSEMATGVIHDTKNQLAIIRSALTLIQDAGLSPRCAKYLEIARQSTDEAAETLQHVLEYSRGKSSSFSEFDLREYMEEVVRSIYPLFNARYELIFRNCDQACVVRGDPLAIRNMLINLSINARDAMPRGGVLTFTLYRADFNPDWRGPEDRSWVCISVRDTGTGMTPEVMRRAFDPLFTTKPAQKGTGLGLWICQCTMTNHEGTISLRSVLGEGTEIVLAFPCAGTSPPDR